MRWIWTYLRTSGENFHEVVPNALYRSATPSPENLEKWQKKYKIAVWLDLRLAADFDGDRRTPSDKTRFFERQMQVARHLGIERVWLPISDRKPTSDESVRSIMYTLERASTERPVLVACQGGRHRTGLAIALYRMRVQHWPATTPDEKGAFDEAKKRGFYDERGHQEFGKRLRQLLGLLLVLLMAVPAFGQGRFVITDGSTQSEYSAPSPERTVLCPVCSDKGERSTVRRWTEPSSYGVSYTPSINYYKSENRYWDEDGKYHDHELAQELLVCSKGHRFQDFDDRRCWCGWPNGRYVVLDGIKSDTITLPNGMTLENYLPTPPTGTVTLYGPNKPVSYQHPFIQPDLESQDSAAAVDRAKTLAHPQSDIYKEDAFNWGFWTASGLWFGASTADLVTTKFALERGGVESNPLHAQDGGRRLRWSSAIAATGGTFAFAAYCERKGHRRVARIVLITGAIVRTGLAFWNNSRRR